MNIKRKIIHMRINKELYTINSAPIDSSKSGCHYCSFIKEFKSGKRECTLSTMVCDLSFKKYFKKCNEGV